MAILSSNVLEVLDFVQWKTKQTFYQEKMRLRLSAGQYEIITDGLYGFEEKIIKQTTGSCTGLLSLHEPAFFVNLYSHFIVENESSLRIEAKAKSVPFNRTIH